MPCVHELAKQTLKYLSPILQARHPASAVSMREVMAERRTHSVLPYWHQRSTRPLLLRNTTRIFRSASYRVFGVDLSRAQLAGSELKSNVSPNTGILAVQSPEGSGSRLRKGLLGAAARGLVRPLSRRNGCRGKRVPGCCSLHSNGKARHGVGCCSRREVVAMFHRFVARFLTRLHQQSLC